MSSTQPVAELLQAATRPMEDARGMPPSVYTSAEFLERERETIFAKEWVCVSTIKPD